MYVAGWADEEINVHSHCSYTKNMIHNFRKKDRRLSLGLQKSNLVRSMETRAKKLTVPHVT